MVFHGRAVICWWLSTFIHFLTEYSVLKFWNLVQFSKAAKAELAPHFFLNNKKIEALSSTSPFGLYGPNLLWFFGYFTNSWEVFWGFGVSNHWYDTSKFPKTVYEVHHVLLQEKFLINPQILARDKNNFPSVQWDRLEFILMILSISIKLSLKIKIKCK